MGEGDDDGGAPRVREENSSNVCIDAQVGEAAPAEAAFSNAAHIAKISLVNNRLVGNPMEKLETTPLKVGDSLYLCTGYYSYDAPHTPEFPGVADFAGQVIHPQFWPKDVDYAGTAEPLQRVWIGVRASLRRVVENVTLADLAANKLPKDVEALAKDPEAWVTRR